MKKDNWESVMFSVQKRTSYNMNIRLFVSEYSPNY